MGYREKQRSCDGKGARSALSCVARPIPNTQYSVMYNDMNFLENRQLVVSVFNVKIAAEKPLKVVTNEKGEAVGEVLTIIC